MPARHLIRTAQSRAADACSAVREFYAAVTQPEMALVVFFCSSDYDLDVLAQELARVFAGVQVVGCTTAGEIGPAGYCEHSIAGASFPSETCTAVTGHLDRLQQFDIGRGESFVRTLVRQLQTRASTANQQNSFAFLLIDGMSAREEQVTHTLQTENGYNRLGNNWYR